MTVWFISRHPGAEQWIRSQNIHYDHHLTHLASEPIAKGDVVIGTLPVNIAAKVCAKGATYWNLSLSLPESARGVELSADELHRYEAKLEPFSIQVNEKALELIELPVDKAVVNEDIASSDGLHSKPSSVPAPSKQELHQWHDALFKAYVFNQKHPDQGEELAQRLMLDYRHRLEGQHEAILQALEKTQGQGKHAVQLTAALLKKIHEGESNQDIDEWLSHQKQSQSNRIGRHLQIVFDKQQGYRVNKKAITKENQSYEVGLEPIALVNGQHPQSIRNLQPAAQWDIYIDETGNDFSAQASERNETDNQLGRIIALALPAGHQLSPLKKPIHAVDLPYKEIEDLLKTLTQKRIGLLGATTKRDLFSTNWISAVHQLTRWLLLLLPLNEHPTQVRVHIENRGEYKNSEQLLALQDTLENELRCLLPERFKRLYLKLHIMHKDNPYNGYVDAIANCWGSKKDATKRKLLARTNWLGHCLLQTDSLIRTEDVYRQISSGDSVEASSWFDLCEASLAEPKQSMLHDMLAYLGDQSKENPVLWRSYLEEVRNRLLSKRFTTASLQVALDWLEHYQQPEQVLPSYLQLELLSQKLASGNHQGETHLDVVEKILPLINSLKDELPEMASQAVLRIAVRSTHLYDFINPMPYVQQWLDYPVAVPGLLNHAKLHSTLGQLEAFQGNHAQALPHFEQALACFARLSDPQQQQRESAQTRLYQILVMQDRQEEEAVENTLVLVREITRRQDTEQAIEHLARSSEPSRRFVHHALVRLLVLFPEQTELRQAYLGVLDEWQSDSEHPWYLINMYRAWLLHDSSQSQVAEYLMQMAIDGCLAVGTPVLTWMGYCIHALGQSLGLEVSLSSHATLPDTIPFPVESLEALAQAGDHAERVRYLQQVLPFNFH